MADTMAEMIKTRKLSTNLLFLWREFGVVMMLSSEMILLAPWLLVFDYSNLVSIPRVVFFMVLLSFGTMMIRRLLKEWSVPEYAVQVLTFLVLPAGIVLLVGLALPDVMGPANAVLRIVRSFGGLLSGIPIEVLLSGFAVYAWARGVKASGRGMMDLNRTGGMIRWGLFSFVFLLIVLGRQGADLRWYLTLYFFTAMLSAAMSRTDTIARSHLRFKLPMNTGWFGGIVVLTLLTIAMGVFSGFIFQSDAVSRLVEFFSGTFAFLMRVLEFLLYPVLYVFGMLFSLLLRWLSPQINEENMFAPEEGMASDVLGMPFGDAMLGEDGTLSPGFVTGLALVSILMVAVMVMWGIRRSSLKASGNSGGLESDTEPDSFLRGLQRLIDGVRGRLGALGDLKGIRQFLIESSIRRIYAKLLRYAARNDVERVRSETPFEFQQRLNQKLPHLEDDVRRITGAYVEVRYGEFPEDPEALEAVRCAWENIQAMH